MGFGGVLLFALSMRPAVARPAWAPMRRPLTAGTVCLVIYPLCFYGAMHYAGVALGTAINIGSSPIMAMGIEAAIGRGRPTPRKLVAAGLSIIGLALLTLSTSSGDAPNPALGVALGLIAGFTYAGYTAAAHTMIGSGWPSVVAMGRMFGLAALVLVPFFFITSGPILTHASGWGAMVYLAVIPMGLAYVLFGYGLTSTPASTAVTLTLIEPVVASTLAVLIIGESLALIGWLGLLLVLVGVFILGRADENAARAEPDVTPLP